MVMDTDDYFGIYYILVEQVFFFLLFFYFYALTGCHVYRITCDSVVCIYIYHIDIL